ncbi:hypothetical protein [Parasediminibacterium sp. JCM 36343]|uniref:hypothetical protein n=1 Tax=Parasediminibacterium sp. JCM 36343 TaxID=3374279 RepID=UPI00397C2048
MERNTRLSYLMVLSWEIQRKKKYTRKRALQAAWAITLNEDITVYYLVKRHGNRLKPNKPHPSGITLFSNQ